LNELDSRRENQFAKERMVESACSEGQDTLRRCAWSTRLRSKSRCIHLLMGARQGSHETRSSPSLSRFAGPLASLLASRILIWHFDLEVVWPTLWHYERFKAVTGRGL
jgi:hypothetical protein